MRRTRRRLPGTAGIAAAAAIAGFAANLLLGACSRPRQGEPGPEAPIAGRWEGIVALPSETTHVAVDLAADDAGALQGTLSTPEGRLLGKPLVDVRYRPPRLHFALPTAERRIVFDGTRRGEAIAGTVHGGRIAAPLVLRRTGAVPATLYAQREVRRLMLTARSVRRGATVCVIMR